MDDHTDPAAHIYGSTGHGRAQGRAQVPAVHRPALAVWPSRLFKAVISAGALAAAVTAVLVAVQAVHPADEENFAEFKDVRIRSGVPYNEYRQRLVPPAPVGRGATGLGRETPVPVPVLIAVTAALPTAPPAQKADPEAPPATAPRTTTPPMWPPGTTMSGPGTSPATPFRLPKEEAAQADQGTLRLVLPGGTVATPGPEQSAGACQGDLSCLRIATIARPTNPDGTPMDRANAEVVYHEILTGSRTTSAKKGKKQMIGVVINVNVELSGLRGTPVLLSWSFWRGDGTTQVYGTWLNDNYAYELIASSDHDSAAVNFWIPLPKKKGPYFIRSKLTQAGQQLATDDSEPIS